MATQLRIVQNGNPKEKSDSKTHEATEELVYLMTLIQSITQAMARTLQDLSDCVFIKMANLTLIQYDSNMDYLKVGVKYDTLAAFRNSSLFKICSFQTKELTLTLTRHVMNNVQNHLELTDCLHNTQYLFEYKHTINSINWMMVIF